MIVLGYLVPISAEKHCMFRKCSVKFNRHESISSKENYSTSTEYGTLA